MILDERPITFDRLIRFGITAAILWGIVWLLGYLSDVLIPFAAALLLAYLINPLVSKIQEKIPNRAAAVFISLALVVIIGAGALVLITPMVVKEIANMGHLASEIVNNSELADRIKEYLPSDIWAALNDYFRRPEVQQYFQTDSLWKFVEPAAKKVLPGVWGVISGTASLLMGLMGLTIVVLYLIFLLLDYQKVRVGWKELIPAQYRESVVEFIGSFDTAMNRYFRAQALVAFIVGILFAIGFSIIGLPMGILLGLLIGLLNMVPYLQILGLLPAGLLALVHALESGSNVWLVMGMTGLVFVVVQLIQDAVLVPKIMGKVTGLSPAMILLSLSIWGKLLGMLGLLIALPMTALLYAYYQRFLAKSAQIAELQNKEEPAESG